MRAGRPVGLDAEGGCVNADLDRLQALIAPLFPGTMGVRIVEASADCVRAELDVVPDLCTAGGTLHGGAHMAFADTLGAIGTIVNLPPGKSTTTASSSTQFLAAAKAGTTVTGESVPLHKGRTTQVWQTTVRTADGKACSVVTQTQLVLDAPPPPRAP
jgi:uncharacterized protein (TIGR00369 family)